MFRLSQSILKCGGHSVLGRRFYAEGGLTGKLVLNFSVPHQLLVNKATVKQVNLSSTDGDMGILADHVPTIARLKPGVVEVFPEDGSSKTEKYFVTGGFAVMNDKSTLNINAVEAVPLDQVDFSSVPKALEEASRRAATASLSEVDQATAGIELEIYEALNYASAKV